MKKEAMEVLLNRRAIRKFKPDAIPADVLDAVLEAGTFAPTGSGRQSPVILVVQDEEKVNKVKKLNAKVMGTDRDPYYGAPVILLVLATEKAVNEEIAILDSVTVSIAALITGMLREISEVSLVLRSIWLGTTQLSAGTRSTSSKVRPSRMFEHLPALIIRNTPLQICQN